MGRKMGLAALLEERNQQRIKLRNEETQRIMAELVQSAQDRLIDSRFFDPVRITEDPTSRLLLIEDQEIALAARELLDYSATEELIREKWQPQQFSNDCRSYFTSFDRETLVFLISGRSPTESFPDLKRGKAPELLESLRLTPEAALEQINDFCLTQLRAIVWLYAYGLRAHHLRAWRDEKGTDMFMLYHSYALESLVIEESRTVEDALHLLHGKSEAEVSTIRRTVAPQAAVLSATEGKDCSLTNCSAALHRSVYISNDGKTASAQFALQQR